MFVQVMKGRTNDPGALRQRLDTWKDELAGGAQGWLGSTAGVTDDGTFVAAVQFESAEAARRNSDRPEQGEWWSQTEKLLTDVEFADADEVATFLNGADPSARFVQVIEADVNDRDKARTMGERAGAELPNQRPDVLGGVVAMHGDRATQIVYFTDEQSAREGESRQMSPEEQAAMADMADVFGDTTYLDLRDPWHHQP